MLSRMEPADVQIDPDVVEARPATATGPAISALVEGRLAHTRDAAMTGGAGVGFAGLVLTAPGAADAFVGALEGDTLFAYGME